MKVRLRRVLRCFGVSPLGFDHQLENQLLTSQGADIIPSLLQHLARVPPLRWTVQRLHEGFEHLDHDLLLVVIRPQEQGVDGW